MAERDIPLIEDDVYGSVYFGDKAPRPAKSYDLNNLVLSCSSFSKTLRPGHRIGWAIPGRYRKKFLQYKQAWSSATSSINQLALAEFLSSGQYERHLVRLRVAMREQVEKGRYLIARNFPPEARAFRTRTAAAYCGWKCRTKLRLHRHLQPRAGTQHWHHAGHPVFGNAPVPQSPAHQLRGTLERCQHRRTENARPDRRRM